MKTFAFSLNHRDQRRALRSWGWLAVALTSCSGASVSNGGPGPTAGGASGRGGSGASTAGTEPLGGEAGTGGEVGVAGDTGRGGEGGIAGPDPGLTDVTKLTPAKCSITAKVTPASDMGMVGVATFKTDLEDADRAIIQFGKTTSYTLEAPVNWDATNHETWLLGMPASTTVHYRVIVLRGTTACIGDDASYETGDAPRGSPGKQSPQKGPSSAAVAPGFIIAVNGYFAYIVNVEGEVVWAHEFPVILSRALMSWDGMYMYVRDPGVFNAGTGGAIYRVAMDGSGETPLEVPGGSHHDLVAIPTGFAYLAKQAKGECDWIYTARPDGSNAEPLVNLDVVFSHFMLGPSAQSFDACHVNAIRYYKDTDSYSVSERELDVIAFISGQGELLGSVGATPTSSTPNHVKAEGADSLPYSIWRVQHGHDLYEPNKLVLWSNGYFTGGRSYVLHYTLNGATATLDWQYTGAGNAPTYSDAQHLPNGNFLVTNSQSGAVHEIDAHAVRVQSFESLTKAGYSCHRTTLYGLPPGR